MLLSSSIGSWLEGILTPEMSARLRAIREKAGTDKGDVAARMG